MIHLDLQPEVEAQLVAEADSRRIALERYLQQIVDFRADALDAAEELQLQQNLQQGLREIAADNTLPAREVFAELREEYDLRGQATKQAIPATLFQTRMLSSIHADHPRHP